MSDPAAIDIIADRRVNFLKRLSWIGRDFTGATFLMEVRAVKDTTGTALVHMVNGAFSVDSRGVQLLYAGTALISAHIAAGRLNSVPDAINPATGVNYALSDSVLLSQTLMFIEKATVQGLPFPEERGDDWQGWYDFHVTPSGGGIDGQDYVAAAGKFVVRAGVSIPA